MINKYNELQSKTNHISDNNTKLDSAEKSDSVYSSDEDPN